MNRKFYAMKAVMGKEEIYALFRFDKKTVEYVTPFCNTPWVLGKFLHQNTHLLKDLQIKYTYEFPKDAYDENDCKVIFETLESAEAKDLIDASQGKKTLTEHVRDLWHKLPCSVKYSLPLIYAGAELSQYGVEKNNENLIMAGIALTATSIYGVMKDFFTLKDELKES